jgi:HK97 family phage major capsid protein
MKHMTMIALAATGAVIVPETGLILPRSMRHGSRPIIRADVSDPKAMFEELRKAVEALRTDIPDADGIKAIVDPLIVAKETAINETITNLEDAMNKINAKLDASINAPVIGDIPGNPEYVTNFKTHMRKGDNAEASVQAAMSIGTAADGGYLAPVEWDRSITEALQVGEPHPRRIRRSSPSPARASRGFMPPERRAAGWVGETAARPQTTTPQFSPLTFNTGELYANPAITQPRSMTRRSIWRRGWPTRCVPSSDGRKTSPSSRATAPTSRSAS